MKNHLQAACSHFKHSSSIRMLSAVGLNVDFRLKENAFSFRIKPSEHVFKLNIVEALKLWNQQLWKHHDTNGNALLAYSGNVGMNSSKGIE
ncbi:hypothetical protein AQUCO_03800201v1 [Aquilegia coerulea]|uniref:Uncharacterized protein n=1 Tax=Aquilegia coerulea TaxID=218851 RepID=A0A2G5CT52_AQUCA|nr:hypothetical protein AQUCO_03800201v1 [Aquilegia coerulea]